MLRSLGETVAKEIDAQLDMTARTDYVASELKSARDEDRQVWLARSVVSLIRLRMTSTFSDETARKS